MSKEKNPRNPALAKSGSAKKTAMKPEPEVAALEMASAVPAIKTAKTKTRTAAKSVKNSPRNRLQVNPAVITQTDLEEAIRFRAYEIYLQRGGMPGNPREDWAVAEREILAIIGQNADA
jgi:hypothetical protein